MKTNYHEKETIVLKANSKLQRKSLHSFLKKRCFKSEDDFYELFRKARCQSWQSSAIIGITVHSSGKDVYETEKDIEEGLGSVWDELRCDYLLATLPRECISDFVREVDALITGFKLKAFWNGEELDVVEVEKRLNRIADQLSTDWDIPGSETLRILILQEYPRR